VPYYFLEKARKEEHMSTLVQVLEKLTRSVDEERRKKQAGEELLYTLRTAQHRRQANHRKPFLSFQHVSNTTSFSRHVLPISHLWIAKSCYFDKSTADHK